MKTADVSWVEHASPRPDLKRRIGALAWLLSVQFFATQWIVARAWSGMPPYDLSRNFISDLGAAHRAIYPAGSHRFVSSPFYGLMNASFCLEGLIMVVGALLLRPVFPSTRLSGVGLRWLKFAGLGIIMVGLAPEDVNSAIHRTGAAIDFIAGSVALVMLGAAWIRGTGVGSVFGRITAAAGILGIVGTVLLVVGIYLGLGIGGMERVAAYPLPIWLIYAGAYFLRRNSIRTATHA